MLVGVGATLLSETRRGPGSSQKLCLPISGLRARSPEGTQAFPLASTGSPGYSHHFTRSVSQDIRADCRGYHLEVFCETLLVAKLRRQSSTTHRWQILSACTWFPLAKQLPNSGCGHITHGTLRLSVICYAADVDVRDVRGERSEPGDILRFFAKFAMVAPKLNAKFRHEISAGSHLKLSSGPRAGPRRDRAAGRPAHGIP